MTIPRSKPPRNHRAATVRFFLAFTLTTTMVATGAFGAIPNNPVTTTFKEEVGKNIPESFLNPVNSYLDELSVPTIPPQLISQPKVPLDVVGLFLAAAGSETSVALSSPPEPSETVTAIGAATMTETPILTATSTATEVSD